MKKAVLIALSLLLVTTPFALDATSDEEVGMEQIDISEVIETHSTSSSSDESESSDELEKVVRPKKQEISTPSYTPKKRRPLWKPLLGALFVTLIPIGLVSDSSNAGYGFLETRTTIAVPYNESLPANGEQCEYSYIPHCNGVINEELCLEYLDQSPENEIIIGECVVDERDETQLSLGIISFFTRFVTAPFAQHAIGKMFYNG